MVISINTTVCTGLQNSALNLRMRNYFIRDNSVVEYVLQRDVSTIFLWSNCHKCCLLNNAPAYHTLHKHFVFWRRLLFSTLWCTTALPHQCEKLSRCLFGRSIRWRGSEEYPLQSSDLAALDFYLSIKLKLPGAATPSAAIQRVVVILNKRDFDVTNRRTG